MSAYVCVYMKSDKKLSIYVMIIVSHFTFSFKTFMKLNDIQYHS